MKLLKPAKKQTYAKAGMVLPASYKPSHVALPSPEACAVTSRPTEKVVPPLNSKPAFAISAGIKDKHDFKQAVLEYRNPQSGRFELYAEGRATGMRFDDPHVAYGLQLAGNRLTKSDAWRVVDREPPT